MANLNNEIKTFFLKGLEAIGDAASNISASAKQKLDEMRLESRRDELCRELPAVVLETWKDGQDMPEKLRVLIEELNDLNAQLAAMRAKPEKPASETEADEQPADEAAPISFEEALDNLENKVEEAADAVEELVETKVEQVEDAVKEKFTPADDEVCEPIQPDDSGDNA